VGEYVFMSFGEKRERFGRYLILDHLVDGGMAKICRARFLGEQADKIVAIKMVQPQYSKDEAFSTMFMDEIKVTFGLIHPNIVQTYDYGFHQGQLFVAMEYCDGKNLKEYLEKLKQRKFVFPVEVSTFIISQACQGLFYAHTFRDKLTGVDSNIIHRDISPHNIMLTYDGAIKIIDFGIAKSQKSSEATQAGTIKGKLSYLAPEYLEGLELDARYDQFAIGITFWEMLCSRKLFKENNDLAVLKKIQECKIPAPSSINPNVPKELDEIVLKALSKDRNKRYENLDQMNRALMKFLYAKYPDFNSTDLSYFAQELFREEIKKDREKLFEFGKIQIKPYLEELKSEIGGAKARSSEDSSQQARKENILDFGFENDPRNDTKSRGRLKQTTTTSKRSQELHDGTAQITSHGTRNKIARAKAKEDDTAQHILPSQIKKKVDKTQILSEDESKIVPEPQEKSNFIKIASLVAILILSASFYFYQKFTQVDQSSQTNNANQVLNTDPLDNPGPMIASNGQAEIENFNSGTILFSHFDKQKMQVFVDGEKVTVSSLNSISVSLNKDITVRVQIEGREHFIYKTQLRDKSAVEVEIPDQPQAIFAYINTASGCSGLKGTLHFNLWGEDRVVKIPMVDSIGVALPLKMDAREGFALPTNFEILFKEERNSYEKNITVNLQREDESIDVCYLIN